MAMKDNSRKKASNARRGKYKRSPAIVAERKDRHVLKSSRGKFRSVKQLEAHRKIGAR